VHGRLHESHLNSVFSSRSFFQVGDVLPARENDYGAEFLAPLWRNSSISLQGNQQKIRGMVNGNVLVLLPGERTPLATDPTTRAYIQRIINGYPAATPNRPDIGPRMLNANSAQRINGDMAAAQLDQAIGARDHLTFRHQLVFQQVDAFQLVAGQNPDTTTRSHQSRFTWNRQWRPATLSSLSLGFDRVGSLLVTEPNNVGPSFSVGGLTDLGPNPDIPTDRADNVFRAAFQVGHVRGSHTFTIGSELLRRRFNGLQSDVHRGSVSFRSNFGRDGITNLRLGTPTILSVSVGNAYRGFRSWNMMYYFGDKWRAGTNLTLTYGLQYQPAPAPNEVNYRNTFPYGCDCNNLAPQFGLAYSLPGRMGVLRAAYGLHYGAILPVTYGMIRFAPPEITRRVIQQPNLVSVFSGAYASATAGQGARESLYILDPNLVQPYSHLYNFSWEPKLTGAWRIQLGYVGSRTLKLVQMMYVNRAQVMPGGTTANIDDRRPDPRYSEVRYLLNTSRAWFDAAKITLLVPRWKGLSLDASYWFSKALDLGANYGDTGSARFPVRSQWEFDSHRDLKSLTDFDQPHAFLIRSAYDTPRLATPWRWLRSLAANWNISAVVLMKTGTPFMVETGSDGPGYGNVDGTGDDRPNLLDPSILGRTIGNPDTATQLLPRSAFGFIQPGQVAGTLGRNVNRKGPIRNINAALARRLPLAREKVLLLRAESINFLNTPQFAKPGTKLTDGEFGTITNTLNEGRTFRFSMSFEF
jgi:hypothetical protein